MSTYIGLVRGINVGSRQIAMADLRQLAEGEGLQQVRTLLNTGNLILESDYGPLAVRERLEGALSRHFGEPIPVAVRTPAQMAGAVSSCPFEPQSGEVVYVGFLVEPASPAALAGLSDRLPRTEDRLEVGNDAVFILYRNGVHTSPLSNVLLERRLKVGVTSRNLNTVRRLAEAGLWAR